MSPDVICHICTKKFQRYCRAVNAKYCSRRCYKESRRRRYRETHQPRGPLRYSPAELEFIRNNYKTLGCTGCAKALRRGVLGVQSKANIMGLYAARWSAEEIRYIREHYTADGAVAVAAALVGRKPHNVMTVAREYNIPCPARKKNPQPTIKARRIIDRVATEHGCTSYDILSSSTRRWISRARRQVIHELHALRYSAAKIGRCLGIDHTSALYALKRSPLAPTGNSSAHPLATQPSKEAVSETALNAHTVEVLRQLSLVRLAGVTLSQPEREAAE